MTDTEWKRLAALVVRRRVELGMKTTKSLADRAGLTARMLGDVENARRTNYSAGAKAQIENALRWADGSIDAVLTGGDPTIDYRDYQTLSAARHPSRGGMSRPISEHIKRDPRMADLMRRLVSGEVDEDVRAVAEQLLDEINIESFPKLYQSLTRTGQLRVAEYGALVESEEEQGLPNGTLTRGLLEGEINAVTSPNTSESGTPGAPSKSQEDELTRRRRGLDERVEDDDPPPPDIEWADAARTEPGHVKAGDRVQHTDEVDQDGPEDGA